MKTKNTAWISMSKPRTLKNGMPIWSRSIIDSGIQNFIDFLKPAYCKLSSRSDLQSLQIALSLFLSILMRCPTLFAVEQDWPSRALISGNGGYGFGSNCDIKTKSMRLDFCRLKSFPFIGFVQRNDHSIYSALHGRFAHYKSPTTKRHKFVSLIAFPFSIRIIDLCYNLL